MVRCCNLRQEAIASCIIPICLGILFLLTAFADLKSVAFVGVCLIFGAVTLATGILGVVGVSAKATTAIEVAVPLLVSISKNKHRLVFYNFFLTFIQAIENSVAVIVGCILLINVIFLKKYQPSATTTTTSYGETQTSNLTAALTNPENAHMATFLTSETTSTEATIQKYHWLGYFIAVLFILLGLLGFFVNQLLGAYKTELSVDQLVAERKTLWKQFEVGGYIKPLSNH